MSPVSPLQPTTRWASSWKRDEALDPLAMPAFPRHCRKCITQWESRILLTAIHFTMSFASERFSELFFPDHSLSQILGVSHSILFPVLTTGGSTSVGAGGALDHLPVLLGLMTQEPARAAAAVTLRRASESGEPD